MISQEGGQTIWPPSCVNREKYAGRVSEPPENIVIGALEDLPERGQLADPDVVVAGFDVGVEVPRHIDPHYLQPGGDLLLGEPGLVAQLAEVGPYAKILFDLLIHSAAHPQPFVWQSTHLA